MSAAEASVSGAPSLPFMSPAADNPGLLLLDTGKVHAESCEPSSRLNDTSREMLAAISTFPHFWIH